MWDHKLWLEPKDQTGLAWLVLDAVKIILAAVFWKFLPKAHWLTSRKRFQSSARNFFFLISAVHYISFVLHVGHCLQIIHYALHTTKWPFAVLVYALHTCVIHYLQVMCMPYTLGVAACLSVDHRIRQHDSGIFELQQLLQWSLVQQVICLIALFVYCYLLIINLFLFRYYYY